MQRKFEHITHCSTRVTDGLTDGRVIAYSALEYICCRALKMMTFCITYYIKK